MQKGTARGNCGGNWNCRLTSSPHRRRRGFEVGTLCPARLSFHKFCAVSPQQGIIYTPLGVVVHPAIDVNTHTQTVLPPIACTCVYCSSGAFVHSVGFYALAIEIGLLSVLLCLASVCIIIRILSSGVGVGLKVGDKY